MTEFGVWTLLPPAIAIIFAMFTRKVYQALLLGILVAGFMVAGADHLDGGGNPWLLPFAAMAGGFANMVAWVVYGIAGVDNGGNNFYSGHASVLAFTVFLGGLVAIMQRAGGVAGFGLWFLNKQTGRRGGMLFASVGGMFLAIDDYFHVIAAGSVFRPVTDRLKISREKLSYLIDSTAAPMVILVPISTWAGYIIGEISKPIQSGDITVSGGAFRVFLEGIPFNFYAVLTILFVIIIAASGRDWGPMRKAESRALTGNGLSREGAKPLMTGELDAIEPSLAPKARNLIVPVLFLIFSTVVLLATIGGFPETSFGTAIQNNPTPELTLAISSFLTLLFALSFYAFQGMKQDDFTERVLDGAKAMMPALAILALAWGIGNAVGAVGLADWISSALGDSLKPEAVPLIAFVLGAVIAFATGTSFGTFAIMIPIALPVAFAAGGEAWLGPALAASIGGAVFGDHCSPISDTTVMSSMAAQADHIDHVRTQIPYALLVAGIATAGYGALAITGETWLAWLVNILLLGGSVVLLRKPRKA